MWQLT